MKGVKVPKVVLKNMGCSTQREYRRLKRRQLRRLQSAMNDLMLGVAHAPGYDREYAQLDVSIEALAALWSPKEWGA